MAKKKILTEEPVQRFGIRKLSVGVLSVLVSSALVGNAAKAHAETTTNVEKTATDESDATSSSKTVTAESGIVVDKANNTVDGDTSTSESTATTPTSTKDTKEAKDDQSGTTSANDESSSTTESTATNSAAEGENEVAGDAASKEESTKSTAQATTSEVKSDTRSTQENQTSSQASSKDDSAAESNSSASNTSVASSLATSFALPLSTKEKMEAAVNKLMNDAPTETKTVAPTETATPVAQKAKIKYVDVSTGTPVELSEDIITGKSNSVEVYTGGNQEVSRGTDKFNAYNVDSKIDEYLNQGYALVENNIPSSSLKNGCLLFDNDTSKDQEYTVSFINTNNQYNLNLAYYDVVTGQTIATKSVKTNEQIDFPVPDGYTLAAPGQPIAGGDTWTFYPGITMPKIIGKEELQYFVNNVTANTPIVVPVYKTNGVTITRTINLHKPDGTVETIKQPVVFKNSVKSTPISPREVLEVAVLAPDLNLMVMPVSEQDKTYTFDTWLLGTHTQQDLFYDGSDGYKVIDMPSLNIFDTSTWSATDVEKFSSKKHSLSNGTRFYTQYEVKVSGYKADGTDTWESYTTPTIAGYKATLDYVDPVKVKISDSDVTVDIYYTTDTQNATVTYIDDNTGKELTSDALKGNSGAKSGYTTADKIKSYQDNGYELVSDDTNGQEVVFDDDASTDQKYTVHLKHGTVLNSLTDTVNRTINYKMSDGSKAPDSVHDTLTYTANTLVDKVTGEILSTEWSPAQDFKDVTSPEVAHYVPDRIVVSNKGIAHDSADIVEEVTYTPKNEAQKATVTYVDSLTGKTIMTKELVGKSNAASGYKTEADIKSLVDKGYIFESDETKGEEVVFDDDATVDQNYVVKLTHKFETSEETHQATRKIRLHEPDDLKVITQIGTVKRSVKIDSVTGEKTYGDWTQDKWDEFNTPVLDGYTASLDKLEEKAVGGDTKDEVVDIYYNKPEEPAPAPEEPASPAEPVPTKPEETPEKTEKPAEPAQEKKEAPAPAKPKEKPTVVTTTQAQLPQTGNKDDKMVKTSGVLAAGASLMATLFSSFKKKSK